MKVKRSSVLSAAQVLQANSLRPVKLTDLSFRGKFVLWGKGAQGADAFNEAIRKHLGLDLPQRCGDVTEAGAFLAIWANPNRWYVVSEQSDEPKLAAALASSGQVNMSVTDGQCCFNLEGAFAVDLLKKGCSLNFSETTFSSGQCLQTRLAITKVFLHRRSSTSFDIYVERSYGEFIWNWLVDAAQEF
ncbi:TPA: sarcosine oxidase subunit gamma [Pseudomonas aeruginosa]|uniref:sarcosine oxidase subunit gamma n=1 Tax=Pseudomonas TaxID=286 RepID=UPI0003C7D57D|nr:MULTISPECIES: sarcosine oxidase subunit gamma family protein [Pseudomonas]EKX2957011.1 hypothetical protein [Pseudomonas aeruginosa]MBG4113925.1 hypothetical protein [Pseudomonas aeruginosa]MBI6936945.1 hypothetical protein [Pseudomonas aeruginosa]MBI8014268.1 hypothetical protein [Pseudomonas aeruginosa]MBV6241916.1 hypothetical protein [Pseudomonas aeruginosa]